MKTLGRSLWLVPVFAVLLTAPASAQRWKWDLGVYGGYSWFSPMLDEEDTGLPDDVGSAEVHYDAGWLTGVQIGFNIRPNLTLRVNTRYSDRPIVGSDIENTDFVTATNLWAASLDLLFRLRQPADEFAGMEMMPFIALGLGAKWMNPGEDKFMCNDVQGNESFACAPFFTGGTGPARRDWAHGEKNSLMGLVGFGIDWRLGRNFMLRTEINDQIYSPQVYRAQPVNATTWNLPNEDNQSKLVNEIAGTIGLHFLAGVERPAPVVVVAPPPPPPVQPPPPPPAPREEQITVCVVDPTAPGGLRMQTATLVESRDTFVVVSGNRTRIGQAITGVNVATGADWYVRGQPLVMTVGTQRVEFTTYGSSQRISAQDLAYLGTVNGFPVYADRDDVSDVISELNELNRTRPNTDLGVLLNDQRVLRTNLEDVRMFYVPVFAYNCVFQGVQRAEPVTKGK